MDANIVNRFWHNALQRQQSLTSHTHTVLSSNHNTCTDHCEFVHDLNVQTWSYLPSIADITAILDSLIPCVTHCQEDRDWVDSASGNWTRVSLYQMSHILTCLTIKHHNMSLTNYGKWHAYEKKKTHQTQFYTCSRNSDPASKFSLASNWLQQIHNCFLQMCSHQYSGYLHTWVMCTYTHGSWVHRHMGYVYLDTWVMCTYTHGHVYLHTWVMCTYTHGSWVPTHMGHVYLHTWVMCTYTHGSWVPTHMGHVYLHTWVMGTYTHGSWVLQILCTVT